MGEVERRPANPLKITSDAPSLPFRTSIRDALFSAIGVRPGLPFLGHTVLRFLVSQVIFAFSPSPCQRDPLFEPLSFFSLSLPPILFRVVLWTR